MKSGGVTAPGGRSHGLTFHWPHLRPRISLALAGFLFLSLFLHTLAFYIFQLKYPDPVRTSAPPALVNLLAATPENQPLLQWIESEDPAVIANPHEIIPRDFQNVPYQPSFAEIRTTLKPFDEKETDVPFPAPLNGIDLINATLQPAKQTVEKAPVRRTELKFSGPLAARKITRQLPLKFDFQSSANLDPATFFVGVGPDGKVQYAFLINSYPDHFGSGSESMDRQAGAHLRGVQFAPGGKDVTWGVATYFWGGDAYQPVR